MLARMLLPAGFVFLVASLAAAETPSVPPRNDDASSAAALRQLFGNQPRVEVFGQPGANNTIQTGGNPEVIDELEKRIRELAVAADQDAPEGVSDPVGAGKGPAAPQRGAPAGPSPSVKVFHLRVPAKETAQTLRELFPHVGFAVEPVSNLLIVSAPQADAEIIEALVRQMDVPPARVRISVIVAEIAGGPGEIWEPKGDFTEASRQLAEMARKGSGSILRRMQLATIDNQVATVQIGEEVSVVTGVSRFGPRGETQRTTQRENVGTLLTCTPRSARGDITMELMFEMSRFLPADIATAVPAAAVPAAPAVPATASAAPVPEPGRGGFSSRSDDAAAATPVPPSLTPQKQVATFRGTVLIPSGRAVALTDFATKDVGSPTRIILLVGAEAN